MNRSYTAIDAEEKFLQHHGILGMHWGIRKDDSNDFSYAKVSDKKIRTNKDGSKTIPRGFIFNRVARSEKLDPNVSGGLYVSYGKPDAARYVSNLGPTLLAKLVKEDNDYLQTISTKKNLKLASDDYVNSTVLKVASNNDDIIKKFNGSLYSAAYFNDYNKTISKKKMCKKQRLILNLKILNFCHIVWKAFLQILIILKKQKFFMTNLKKMDMMLFQMLEMCFLELLKQLP